MSGAAAPALASATAPAAMTTAPAPAVDRRRAWRLLAEMLRPHRARVIGAVALNGLHGLTSTAQALVVKPLIVVLGDTVHDAAWRWRTLLGLVACYLLISVVGRTLVSYAGFRLFRRFTELAMRELRIRVFRHVNALCPRFHVRHSSGELYSYLFGTPVNEVLAFAREFASGFAGALVTLLSTLVVVALWDWVTAVVLYAAVVGNVLVMNRSRARMRVLTREYQQVESAVTGRVADLLRGARAVKVHGIEDDVVRTFAGQAELIGRRNYETSIRRHLLQMLNETIGFLAFATLCVVIGWRWMDGHLGEGAGAAGSAAAFVAAFLALQGPLNHCFQVIAHWGAAQASLERISGVLDTASTTPDPAPAQAVAPRPGAIELRGVGFRYAPSLPPALSDVTLTIPYGQRVAVVGPSGAGKTTLAQLLLRLYDPQQGSVSIAGTDLRRCRGADLRRLFGVVPQDPFVFRTSIRDNVAVVRGAADDAEIIAACRRANAWEFIAQAPGQLDTPVGEAGWTLSGGQRQRLAIARVLLCDPAFVIFDEATSALDTVSERLIQTAIEREFSGRTAVIIAHRLATVRHCDRILVMDQGVVVQDGTYAELCAQDGLFRRLVQGQELIASAQG